MTRLIVFGCSLSYGHGLADCIKDQTQPGDYPSKLGWVQILGDMLGLDVVNVSYPGSSNMRILTSILKFEFNPTDTVIIQWSYAARDMIYESTGADATHLGPWVKTSLSNNYYKTHSLYDLEMRSIYHIHHANCYLGGKVDKLTNVVAVNKSHHYFLDNAPEWFTFSINPLPLLRGKLRLDHALDNMHPGPKSQQAIANYIKEFL